MHQSFAEPSYLTVKEHTKKIGQSIPIIDMLVNENREDDSEVLGEPYSPEPSMSCMLFDLAGLLHIVTFGGRTTHTHDTLQSNTAIGNHWHLLSGREWVDQLVFFCIAPWYFFGVKAIAGEARERRLFIGIVSSLLRFFFLLNSAPRADNVTERV